MKRFLTFLFILLFAAPAIAGTYALTDPGADKWPFWDDSATDYVWLTPDADDFEFSTTTFRLVGEIPHLDVAETITGNWVNTTSPWAVDEGGTGSGTASGARTNLGLGSAATRAAEDTLTDGSNLPDGAAIKAYGDANWAGGGGDVTGVGDCASGACLDGSSDGGSYIRIYDGNSNYANIKAGDSTANLDWITPTAYPAGNDYLLQVSTTGQLSTTNTLSSVTFGGFSNSMAVQSDASGNLESSSTISVTELGYLNGLTEAISTSLAATVYYSNKCSYTCW